jgi:hypothetical protein|tara:strand:+ start:334 stop:492 length:159 start_codon:yes stop_codon:yes gene_type:complete
VDILNTVFQKGKINFVQETEPASADSSGFVTEKYDTDFPYVKRWSDYVAIGF